MSSEFTPCPWKVERSQLARRSVLAVYSRVALSLWPLLGALGLRVRREGREPPPLAPPERLAEDAGCEVPGQTARAAAEPEEGESDAAAGRPPSERAFARARARAVFAAPLMRYASSRTDSVSGTSTETTTAAAAPTAVLSLASVGARASGMGALTAATTDGNCFRWLHARAAAHGAKASMMTACVAAQAGGTTVRDGSGEGARQEGRRGSVDRGCGGV